MSVRRHIIVSLKRNRDIIVGQQEWNHLTATQERLVYTHSVDDRLWSHFDVHHGSSEDVARIVRLDLQLIIHLPAAKEKEADGPIKRDERLLRTTQGEFLHLNSLVEVQRHHFLHAVLDHLRGEEVGLSLLVDRDFAEVLQQNGADGLGGMGHVNWPIVAHHLTHEGQSATVVQVEMAEGATSVAVQYTEEV